MPSQVEWRASWRQLPASPAQIRLLRKYKLLPHLENLMVSNVENDGRLVMEKKTGLTKGQACDLITRLFEGGLKEWREQHQRQEKLKKRREKERLKREREQERLKVEVGYV
jgi:hypothetical protein